MPNPICWGTDAVLDCDDMAAAIFPGATQLCDGLNNDCDHPEWPALDETNEVDTDGDGLSACDGDCLASDGAVCLGSSLTSPQTTDATDPTPDHVFFCVVRATNACPAGTGSWGTDSSGAQRQLSTCP